MGLGEAAAFDSCKPVSEVGLPPPYYCSNVLKFCCGLQIFFTLLIVPNCSLEESAFLSEEKKINI